jgi:hypothetical protein
VSLLHHHRAEAERPEDATSFEVLGAEGVVRRYAREDFHQIFVSVDPDEVQRQVGVGWLILDERQVDTPGRGPSGEDLIPGIEGLRVGGVLSYAPGESVTSYVFGYLKADASGRPEE